MADTGREKIDSEPTTRAGTLRMAEVLAGFTRALDLAEGQPMGHAVRSCLIGMRLAKEIYLLPHQRAALFHALLLKDLGATSNATTFRQWLGGDELSAKRNWRTTDHTPSARLGYLLRNTRHGDSLLARVAGFMKAARSHADTARQLLEQRSRFTTRIARNIGLPEESITAIRHGDAPWDGSTGGPVGEEIPMLARITTLAQSAEIFYRQRGLQGTLAIARARSGRSFDPTLVRALHAMQNDYAFWDLLHETDIITPLLTFEPALPDDGLWLADEDDLDRLAEAFGQIVDAKSAWTVRHSIGVAEVAVGIAESLGITGHDLRLLRRAALLHDLGKIAIPNRILEKPAKLDPTETAEMQKHAHYTRKLLESAQGFTAIAHVAAAHHERIDGRGYDRGIRAGDLHLHARILAVADTFEALAARRPYRHDLTEGQVIASLENSAGPALDPDCVDALRSFLEDTGYTVDVIAA